MVGKCTWRKRTTPVSAIIAHAGSSARGPTEKASTASTAPRERRSNRRPRRDAHTNHDAQGRDAHTHHDAQGREGLLITMHKGGRRCYAH
jgi:hypothetical protein